MNWRDDMTNEQLKKELSLLCIWMECAVVASPEQLKQKGYLDLKRNNLSEETAEALQLIRNTFSNLSDNMDDRNKYLSHMSRQLSSEKDLTKQSVGNVLKWALTLHKMYKE